MDVVKISKALADPLRWTILKRIATRSEACCDTQGICVCEMVDELNLLQSKVSYHIKELKEASLIREDIRGRWNFYYLNEETLHDYLDHLRKELIP